MVRLRFCQSSCFSWVPLLPEPLSLIMLLHFVSENWYFAGFLYSPFFFCYFNWPFLRLLTFLCRSLTGTPPACPDIRLPLMWADVIHRHTYKHISPFLQKMFPSQLPYCWSHKISTHCHVFLLKMARLLWHFSESAMIRPCVDLFDGCFRCCPASSEVALAKPHGLSRSISGSQQGACHRKGIRKC